MSIGQFRKFIKASPSLETLVLGGGVVDSASLTPTPDAPPLDHSHLQLPMLRYLTLKDLHDITTLNSILEILDIPHLTNLTISDRHNAEGQHLDFTSTLEMLARDWNRWKFLESLTLDYVEFEDYPRWLDNIYAACSNLERLYVVCGTIENPYDEPEEAMEETAYHKILTYFAPFVYCERGGPICPKLRHIKTSGVPGSLLLKIVRERIEEGERLKSITYDAGDNIKPAYIQRMRRLGVDMQEYREYASDDNDSSSE